MKEYGLYDVTDYEQCEYFGTLKEISKYLNYNCEYLRSYLIRKRKGMQELIQHKYELIEIVEDCETEEKDFKTRKDNKEIFQEIIEIFTEKQIITVKEELSKIKVFDVQKWIVKGLKDKVIIDEEWKQIPQFNYSISNYGRIRNDKNGKLKTLRNHRWIIQVDIYKDGKRYTIDVPRLEATLFIRKLERTERVSYIDGDKRNNYYKNLKIVSK